MGPIDGAFFRERLRRAAELRAAVLPQETSGYRLLNAEGDGVPGWTIDRYGETVVSQITSAGLERMREEAYAELSELLPRAAVLQANAVPLREREGLGLEDEWIRGGPAAEAEFTESGLRFTAELAGGQKTGFYCDQRTNRRLAEELAGRGGGVLDLFAHTGAFTAYALRGGAGHATAVESSPRLVERGRRHLELNGLDPETVEWVEANVFEFLRQGGGRYGLVVCDPPPLVPRRSRLEKGSRAYKDLNRLALGRVAPGGFLLTFTCSAALDAKLFRQILFSAAVESGRRAALLRPLAAGEDHPVAISHLEGEYLRGWLVHVA